MKLYTLGGVVDNLKLDEVAVMVSEDIEQDQKALDEYSNGKYDLASMLFFDNEKRLVTDDYNPVILLSSEESNIGDGKYVILKRDKVDFEF